jgi:hypothetical protein
LIPVEPLHHNRHKSCSTQEKNHRTVATQVLTLPSVPAHAAAVSLPSQFASPMSPTTDAPAAKTLEPGRRYPVSWPPLRTNLRFSPEDVQLPPQQLQAELKLMHANLQRDDLNERKQRILNGERVSIPIVPIVHRMPAERQCPVTCVGDPNVCS